MKHVLVFWNTKMPRLSSSSPCPAFSLSLSLPPFLCGIRRERRVVGMQGKCSVTEIAPVFSLRFKLLRLTLSFWFSCFSCLSNRVYRPCATRSGAAQTLQGPLLSFTEEWHLEEGPNCAHCYVSLVVSRLGMSPFPSPPFPPSSSCLVCVCSARASELQRWDPLVSASLALILLVFATALDLLGRSWGLKSGPHVCVASTLLPEQSFQSQA